MGTSEVWPSGVAARAIERADAEAWAALLAAVEKADHTGENYDADDLIEELGDPKLNAAADTIGLWSDGLMVGYGKVSGPDEVIDIDRIFTEGCVHPQWRRRGLGGRLMTWLTDRASAMHHERHPEAPGEINTEAISTNSSALKVFAARGFEVCRYFFHMERNLGAEPVPMSPVADGLRLVEFDPTYDEALRLAHNEVFLDHWGSTPKDPESWKTWFTGSRAFRAAQSYLVLDGERIAAYVLGYEYVADTAATGIRELYVGHVGTRRDYRGRGAARAALAQVMAVAQDAGFRRVSLGVDAENPTGALGLYEKLGFRTKHQQIRHRLPIG
jgi:mycothiol synthase